MCWSEPPSGSFAICTIPSITASSASVRVSKARIEVFSRRTDDEIEQRHKLAERLSMRRVQTLRRQQKPPLQWLSRRMVQTVRRR
jgi:hypothetical protein